MDATEGNVSNLRPLGLGEILDRAVTLCVRYFWLLAAIWTAFAVPAAICQYFGTQDQSKFFGVLADILKAQSATGKAADPQAISRALSAQPVFNGWTVLWVLLLLLVSPLPRAALIAALASVYTGVTKIDFAEAYRRGLDRWLNLLGLNALFIGVGGALYTVLVLVMVILAIGIGAAVYAMKAVGIVLGVLLGLAAFVAILAFVFLVTLVYWVATLTCVVERVGFVTAFMSGMRRVFVGAGFRRAVLAGLAYVAIGFGIFFVTAMGESVLFGLLHSNLLGTIFATGIEIASAAFTTAFITIFYFDLRVREEGLDLQLAARSSGDALSPT
jgi:hypothetical protein